ncbi:unnamed protein product [Spirodela intermedia]|uniref:Uncharacterized protein n=1 Tax=Spirodela intermedia TaxID=51605 RepID=A0A7I8LJA8_SPIIN|nr:unnamed protein product [Spirodela intermedia]
MAFRGAVLGRMIFVLVVIASSCLECKVTGCRDEERRALLEIKRSINFPNGSALYLSRAATSTIESLWSLRLDGGLDPRSLPDHILWLSTT